MEPLAQRLRPRTLDEVCGQQHLLGKNQVFRRTVESGKIPNMIFYGPSGVGKTTLVERLIGLRPALNGELRIGGVDIADIAPRDRRALFAYAAQEEPEAADL